MITAINHTGLVVTDLQESIGFYRDVLGLTVQGTFERDGSPISQVVGYRDCHILAAHMGTGSGPTIELIQYINPPPALRQSIERNVIGANHVAFNVDDAEKSLETLVKNGATKLNSPTEVSPGRKVCYLQDPDGNWVELVEISS